MNKVAVVALIALAYAFSFSQEGGKAMKFGARAGFVMNSFSTGNSDEDKHINMGMGIGVGGVGSYPLTDIITFNPEAGFLYRTLYNMSESEGGETYEESVSEFALSIPLMFQIMPIAGTPVHFAAGLQIDFPFSTEKKWEEEDMGQKESGNKAVEKRTSPDFGIALGGGWRINDQIGVDLRIVIGLTTLSTEKDDKSSLKQFGLGASYFF